MVDQVEEIKKKIDIVQFINEYVPLKKAGRNYSALCPFHSEKTPSFMVSGERQIWYCFGACSEGGDVIKFLMKIENIDFGEALKELAQRTGVVLRQYRPSDQERKKQLWYEINHLTVEFYHFLLISHPAGKRALDYILGRGIKKESLELFKIGYAPNMWDGLQRFLVGKKGYRGEDLEKLGLVIKRENIPQGRGIRGYYDRFRNRLMFPLKDHRGNICGFAGRVVPEGERPAAQAAEGQAKYINTPETEIYHKSELLYGLAETKEKIKKADRAILVEGELDAISSYQAGVENVIAIKGTALTEDQIQLLERLTKNIAFALDADVAGDKAAKRGIEMADKAGMAIAIVEVKGGKDPDEVAQKDPELWQKMVKESVPVYDYFIDSAFARFEAGTAEGKRKIGQEVVPVLAKISDKIVQAHYVNLLAERLGIKEEAIEAEITKVPQEGSPTVVPESKSGEENRPERREILEEYLLGLCFNAGRWERLRKRKVVNLVTTPRFARILAHLGEYLEKYKINKSERLAKMLEPELQETFNKLFLLEIGDYTDEEKFERELQKILGQIEEVDLREKLREIAGKIRTMEQVKSEVDKSGQDKLNRLSQDFCDLSRRLTELTRKREI